MFWQIIGNALLIFCLRVTDVSLGTIRMTMIMRGHRKWATLLGFVEVTIWVVAISKVITNLDTIWNVFAYSGGFATGTLLGMWIEGKLALGSSDIHIVSMKRGREIAGNIREAGYGATLLTAEGQSGPVFLVNVVAPRKEVPNIIRLANEVDAKAFVTVDDTRQVMRGYSRMIK